MSQPQPPPETNLGERAVACDCDVKLQRPVLLDPWVMGVNIIACLCCRTVTYSRSVGDDGRFTGNAWHGYVAEKIDTKALAWIAKWPRARVTWFDARWPMRSELVRRDFLYLPPDSRCSTLADLEKLEAK